MTDTLARLDRIERRLARVERHLGLAPTPTASPTPTPASVPASVPTPLPAPASHEQAPWRRERLERFLEDVSLEPKQGTEPVAPTAAAKLPPPLPPLPPLSAAAPVVPLPPHVEPNVQTAPAPETAPARDTAPAPVETLRYEARPAPPVGPPRQSPLEQVIGLKLAGWVGAIVLVIGAGLGIKYAYDQGFFGGVHPAVWLSLLSACGLALIGTGEFVYRRVNKISATGLFGAGVATLFLVSYAGHGYYELYQQQTAFTLMALSTLVGAAVAMRGRLVSIAVLSLLGGLLAPLVLEGDTELVTPFLAYLLMLQAVALVLSWWGGSARWWTLRGLSLAGTSTWLAVILWRAQPWSAAMAFTFLYAALYHAEVILSAFRGGRAAAAAAAAPAAPDEIDTSAGVTFTVIVTALLTAATLWLFADATAAVRGIWVATFAAITMLASIALARFAPGARRRALSYGYRVQAAVLLLLSIPVAFSGASISLGWAAMALALAAIGARLDDKPARYTAVIAWALAIVNWIIWATAAAPTSAAAAAAAAARAEWFAVLGQPILAWMAIGWSLAAVGHAIAWLIGARDEIQAPVVSFVASALFAVVTIAALPPLGATAVLLAYAWLLIGIDLLAGRLQLLAQAWTVLAVAAVKWAAVDALASRFAPGWNAADYTPILNPLMLTGVALAGSIVAIYRLRRDAIRAKLASVDAPIAPAPLIVLTAVALLIAIGLSFEIDRVVVRLPETAWRTDQLRHMAWTILWTLLASAYLWLYTRLDSAARQRGNWRTGAWLITGALALKFIIIDTILSTVTWRPATLAPTPLLNFQVVTALVVAGGLAFVYWLLGGGGGRCGGGGVDVDATRDERTPLRVGLAATLVLLWAGTLEIARLVDSGLFPGANVWPSVQLQNFAWSAWWAAGVTGFLAVATRRDQTMFQRIRLVRLLAYVPVLLALKYLLFDTLFFRLFRGPAGAVVAANFMTFAGAILFGCLVLVRYWMPRLHTFAGAIALVMLLWVGSLEIDRAFERSPAIMSLVTDPRLAKQVALSIYFSAFAIASVAAGFLFRTAGLRYFGLGLFALTLLKIGIIDLQNAQTGYRILSFMGLGALLLVTSVIYGKLSPVLLREQDE